MRYSLRLFTTEDSRVAWLSLLGTVKLDSTAAVLDACGKYVMAVTVRGTVCVW